MVVVSVNQCENFSNVRLNPTEILRSGRTEKTSRQFRFHLIICRSLGKRARAIGGIDMDETDTAT